MPAFTGPFFSDLCKLRAPLTCSSLAFVLMSSTKPCKPGRLSGWYGRVCAHFQAARNSSQRSAKPPNSSSHRWVTGALASDHCATVICPPAFRLALMIVFMLFQCWPIARHSSAVCHSLWFFRRHAFQSACFSPFRVCISTLPPSSYRRLHVIPRGTRGSIFVPPTVLGTEFRFDLSGGCGLASPVAEPNPVLLSNRH